MGAIEAKPDLREQIGVAVSAAVMAIDIRRTDAPTMGIEARLTHIAAMGAAARMIAANTDREESELNAVHGLPRAQLAPAPRPGDDLQARLAPLLWRLKYGADATERTVRDAVALFAQWMGGKPAFSGHDSLPMHGRVCLAAQTILEWIDDKCEGCGGTGKRELLRNGMSRRPRRFGQPNIRHCTCGGCGGSGQARPIAMARAQALGVSLADYREHWPHRFDLAGYWLRGVAGRLNTPLRKQLGSGIIAPQ